MKINILWAVNKILLLLLITPYGFWIAFSKYNTGLQLLMILGVGAIIAAYTITTDELADNRWQKTLRGRRE